MEVLDIFVDGPAERLLAKEDQVVEAFAFYRRNETFGVSILLRAAYACLDHFHAGAGQDLAEATGEEGIMVANEEARILQKTVNAIGEIAGQLLHDLPVELASDGGPFRA